MIHALAVLSGWFYVGAWSISMYPQILQNFRAKSLQGMSTAYLLAVVSGQWCYAIYNFSLFFSDDVRDEYLSHHQTHVHGRSLQIPVRVNDVMYAGHGVFLSAVLVLQAAMYRKSSGKSSGAGRGDANKAAEELAVVLLYVALWLAIAIGALMAQIRLVPMGAVLAAIGSCKGFISLFKYAPQVTLHRQLKSCQHYNVWMTVLDLLGGVFAFLQLTLDAYDNGHSDELWANFPKLMLSAVCIWFNAVFLLQRFVLYPAGDGMKKNVV